jgi:hypothetical protein
MLATYRGKTIYRLHGHSMTMFRLFVARSHPCMLAARGAPNACERTAQIAINRKRLSGRQR